MLKFEYNRDFNVESLGNSTPYNTSDQSFLSINKKGQEFGIISMNNYDNKFIHTFKPHNGKVNTLILNKYKLDQIIDVDSVKEIPLFKVEQSRNQFFIPMLIVLTIIIINLFYKGVMKDVKTVNKKLYTIKEDELFEVAINAGAKDCLTLDNIFEVITEKEDFYKVRTELEKKIDTLDYSSIEWRPHNYIELDKDQSNNAVEVLTSLEDLDDVQNIFTNVNIKNLQ